MSVYWLGASMIKFRTLALILSAFSATFAAHAGVPTYEFTIDPAASGLRANLATAFNTAGSLIGNYDQTNNPTGTRTKPGLFGSFGETENLPVAVELGLGLDSMLDTRSSGGFHMSFDTGVGTLLMSGFTSDLLKSGPASIDASATLLTEAFRTRNPSSVYLGGIPVTLPLGQVSLTSLSVTQTEDAAPGVLTPLGGNRYSFLVAPVVQIEGSIDAFGQVLDIPPTAVPLPLAGEIELIGDTARLTSVQPVDLMNTADPNLALPELPFDLPTILPPGGVASVLFNLTLESLETSLVGQLATVANGVLVPEPSTLALLAAGLLALRRRR
jgi:PEP-CTERM motif